MESLLIQEIERQRKPVYTDFYRAKWKVMNLQTCKQGAVVKDKAKKEGRAKKLVLVTN